MREYLDLEFRYIEPTPPCDYSLERIIDDFILLPVIVGNDFLPNLPDLHRHKHRLERLFDVFKNNLPLLGKFLYVSRFIWSMNSQYYVSLKTGITTRAGPSIQGDYKS